MSNVFNAYEVFEIAEQIERNGGKFYRQAADMANNEDAKKFLLELAEMEDQHEDFFQSLKEKYKLGGDQEVPDLDSLTISYLQAVAGGNVFVASNTQTELLKGSETVEEIIKVALDFEKDSVIYFNTVKKLIPDEDGKAKVDALAGEEVRHIAMLLDKMDELKKA